MTIKILVVDDSSFFRRRITEIIQSDSNFKVIGAASNGTEAVAMVKKLRPDVVTMDYEMPGMDGISAVRHIMQNNPTPILMLSSLTYEGARVTLDALEAGAVDFLPKNFAEVTQGSDRLKRVLHERLKGIVKQAGGAVSTSPTAPSTSPSSSTAVEARSKTRDDAPLARVRPALNARAKPAVAKASEVPAPREPAVRKGPRKSYSLLAIGASTGGPVALAEVLKTLPKNFPLPIVLIQHMPNNFTKAFAERLNRQCQIDVKEAEDGDKLRPGLALLAPGGMQMMVSNQVVKVLAGDDRLNYKPSVDITFGSAAKSFPGKVLAVILTGMGADGKEGARLLKGTGATVWSQDQESSVIYGMPMAVAKAGLSDRVLSLTDVGPAIVKEV